jgi:hypothetical protein
MKQASVSGRAKAAEKRGAPPKSGIPGKQPSPPAGIAAIVYRPLRSVGVSEKFVRGAVT